MPTHGFSIKPLQVKLLAGEQKATEGGKMRKAGRFWMAFFSGHAEGNSLSIRRVCLLDANWGQRNPSSFEAKWGRHPLSIQVTKPSHPTGGKVSFVWLDTLNMESQIVSSCSVDPRVLPFLTVLLLARFFHSHKHGPPRMRYKQTSVECGARSL